MIPLIGIAGKARSGKDTLAEIIVESEQGAYRYSFADPIRAMLKAGLGINMQDPFWAAHKEDVLAPFGKSPRQMMQTLGTEWGRNCVHENLWVLLARSRYLMNGPGMVIADVRFPNEAEWIRAQGGLLIHLLRGDVPEVAAHSSEAGVGYDARDRSIRNDGTIDNLRVNAMKLLHEWEHA